MLFVISMIPFCMLYEYLYWCFCCDCSIRVFCILFYISKATYTVYSIIHIPSSKTVYEIRA